MIVVPSVLEFFQRTAPVFDFEFEDVSIIPDSPTGDFFGDRLVELKEFCSKNGDYHIISIRKGCLWFNKPLEDVHFYRLRRGDSDPRLVCFEHYKLASL